jgi:N-acetylglucosaminyldiphosphoundecaprenol N-acetyl-beta-D-mannosaminyltransferase
MIHVEISKILGVNINVTNMDDTLDNIVKSIDNIKGKYICVSNVHTTIMAYDNENYKNVQNSAYMRLPDGSPLAKLCNRRGHEKCSRVTGPDLMKEIFKISEQHGYSHFFYGSTAETLSELESTLKSEFPKLNIAGVYSPPFRELTEPEDTEIIKMINEKSPDFLWIGLGAPKQEIWMYNHKDKINSLMIGVGAGFDYMTGKIKRAPVIMQKLSLEWLYRLIQDPKRLWKRYVVTNFKFIYLVFIKGIK